jgi:aminomethyltransferase
LAEVLGGTHGYTGEDGFEIMCDAADAPALWEELLKRGKAFGIKPCGLGARDTLRLEVCYPLHGNDITEETTPIEAGLGKFVSFDKGPFVGRDVLAEQKEKGVSRKLVAFTMTGKSPPPRPHYPILANGRKGRRDHQRHAIAHARRGHRHGLRRDAARVELGTPIEIEIRGRTFPATLSRRNQS